MVKALRSFFVKSSLKPSSYSKYRVVIHYNLSIFRVKGMEQETAHILENIRKKRLARHISVLNLANMVGISHSNLFYIESQRVIPSIDVLVKIAKALQVPVTDLLNESG